MLACVTVSGCWSRSGPEVVVYTALDAEFSQPLFERFSAASGVAVLPKFDAESTKTVGLAEAIIAESARPRCDVFWNNEILHTLRLKQKGLLEAYVPPVAESYPAVYRRSEGILARLRRPGARADRQYEAGWRGRAARVDLRDWPIRNGAAGRAWPSRCSAPRPPTPPACSPPWGDEKAKQFFKRLKENNVQILSGNKQVALAVAAGKLAFGLTDTDDARIEIEKGMPVEIVYPDQEDDGLGTLFIPNTLAIIRGGPNPAHAKELVASLLMPESEAALAAGPSAQIPLNSSVVAPPGMKTPRNVRPMRVDFEAAAEKWDAAAEFLREWFTGE